MNSKSIDVHSKLNDETSYKLLKLLDENPDLSQRELAKKMGVSLGKINYCLQSLIQVGMVKMNNFASSKNKIGYIYVLTPKGMTEKSEVARRFLAKKLNQYEEIKKEIAKLRSEVGDD